MATSRGRRQLTSFFLPVALAAMLFVPAGCGVTSPSSTTSSASDTGQSWLVTFNDSGSAPHPQTVKVYVAPFTTGSTWGEVGDSQGLYMYGPDGVCKYRMMVGGNSSHDSPGDRFTCVNLGASGCGMQTLGRCEFTLNGHFPDATSGTGTFTLTTQSPAGSITGTNTITARRQ
jgi:hypothetical protein